MTYLEWRNYVYNEWLESLVEMNQGPGGACAS